MALGQRRCQSGYKRGTRCYILSDIVQRTTGPDSNYQRPTTTTRNPRAPYIHIYNFRYQPVPRPNNRSKAQNMLYSILLSVSGLVTHSFLFLLNSSSGFFSLLLYLIKCVLVRRNLIYVRRRQIQATPAVQSYSILK